MQAGNLRKSERILTASQEVIRAARASIDSSQATIAKSRLIIRKRARLQTAGSHCSSCAQLKESRVSAKSNSHA